MSALYRCEEAFLTKVDSVCCVDFDGNKTLEQSHSKHIEQQYKEQGTRNTCYSRKRILPNCPRHLRHQSSVHAANLQLTVLPTKYQDLRFYKRAAPGEGSWGF